MDGVWMARVTPLGPRARVRRAGMGVFDLGVLLGLIRHLSGAFVQIEWERRERRERKA